MMVIIVQEEEGQNKERGAQVTGYDGTAGSGVAACPMMMLMWSVADMINDTSPYCTHYYPLKFSSR